MLCFFPCVAFFILFLYLDTENVCPHGVKAPQQPHHMLYNTIDFNLFRHTMEGEREFV